jgi:hypothetical protein
MSLKYKLIAAASVALAAPALAQEVNVDAGVKADTPVAEAEAGLVAGAQAEAGAQVQAGVDAQGQAETEAPPAGEAQGQAQAQGAGTAAAVTPATAADLRVGVAVQDSQGGAVGTIESVDAEGAVVSTGSARAKMPVSSFGRNANGLVISMTKAELEAAVSARSGS